MSVIIPVLTVVLGLLLSVILVLAGAILFVHLKRSVLQYRQYQHEVHESMVQEIQSKQDMLAAMNGEFDDEF